MHNDGNLLSLQEGPTPTVTDHWKTQDTKASKLCRIVQTLVKGCIRFICSRPLFLESIGYSILVFAVDQQCRKDYNQRLIISEGKGRNFILDLYFQWRPAVSACHPFPKYLLSSKDGSQKLTSHIHILIYSGESIISMCEYVCLQKGKSPLRGYFSKIYLFNCFILSILDNLKIFAALLGCI